jgi:hypothetical protein
MSEETRIAYTALANGVAVETAAGEEFGKVEAVLAVDDLDVFDGIVVDTDSGVRFVDADHVDFITPTFVRTTLTSAEARALPEPAAPPVYETDASDDTGDSVADRFGRLFSRGKWKRQD